MNSRGYLIDTNIAIALLAKEQVIIKSEYRLHGVKLFNDRRCLDVNSKIARIAGDIRREQKAASRKLKTPDAIIIATAIYYQLALVSRDSDMNFVQGEYGVPLVNL